MTEVEAWFDADWHEPIVPPVPATFEEIMAACSDTFTEHDLKWINEQNLDASGLVIYLDGIFAISRQKKTGVEFLKERGLFVPEPQYNLTLIDRISNVLEKNSGKALVGVVVLANLVQMTFFTKEKYVPWPAKTKTGLAQVAKPTAQRIATRLETIRLYHPDEIKIKQSGANDVSLELDSFEEGEDFFKVTAYMSKGSGGLPDPETVSEVDVYAGGYINDGRDYYDGQQSLRQEVDIYSDTDVSGPDLWEAEDWQWSPGVPGGYSDADIHIDSINWSEVTGSISAISPDKPLIKDAIKENEIWSRYAEVEADAAFNGDIQMTPKNKK